ncbi:hypothetical protein CGZ93_10465 [Enemella dayhoffiae]|uniref:Uncharacterized protein n=1 Tax=Enemella dayhoffiae TaxID=2016507 RepID=A0A255H1K6_9ACTN|nr:hypothetical protein CGZ93_10465 [Enemella dayhoffiae]
MGTWRADRPTLSERVAHTRQNEARRRGDDPGPTQPATPQQRKPCHVWIDGDHAALLIGWKQAGDRTWWGRVVLVEDHDPQLAWIRQDRLTKA